jgi:hypothetical protein
MEQKLSWEPYSRLAVQWLPAFMKHWGSSLYLHNPETDRVMSEKNPEVCVFNLYHVYYMARPYHLQGDNCV